MTDVIKSYLSTKKHENRRNFSESRKFRRGTNIPPIPQIPPRRKIPQEWQHVYFKERWQASLNTRKSQSFARKLWPIKT